MRCACGYGRNLSWSRGRIAQHRVDLRHGYSSFERAIRMAQADGGPVDSFARLLREGRILEQRLLMYAHGEAGNEVVPSLNELNLWRRAAEMVLVRVATETARSGTP